VTQTVSAERAAALRNTCLKLAKICRSGQARRVNGRRSRDSWCLALLYHKALLLREMAGKQRRCKPSDQRKYQKWLRIE
jgi:hypothetical protein